jgi:hypothetical protein
MWSIHHCIKKNTLFKWQGGTAEPVAAAVVPGRTLSNLCQGVGGNTKTNQDTQGKNNETALHALAPLAIYQLRCCQAEAAEATGSQA